MKITMNGCFIPISCSSKLVMHDMGTDLGGVFLSCRLPVQPIEIFRCPLIKSDDTLLVNFPANNFTRTYSSDAIPLEFIYLKQNDRTQTL